MYQNILQCYFEGIMIRKNVRCFTLCRINQGKYTLIMTLLCLVLDCEGKLIWDNEYTYYTSMIFHQQSTSENDLSG